MKFKHLLFSTLFVTIANNANAQKFIKTTSVEEYFNLTGVSNEGKMVGYTAFTMSYYIWTPESGDLQNIGGVGAGQGFGGQAKFSNDGKFLSGTSINEETGLGEISRYNVEAKKWETLGSLGFNNDYSTGSGFNISGDGKTVVGGGWVEGSRMYAIVWNEKEGLINLGTLVEKRNTRATAVSEDGGVVVGFQENKGGDRLATIWKKNPVGGYFPNIYIYKDPKGDLNDPYNILPEITAVSGDGKWVGGVNSIASPNVWIWSEENGLVDLGSLATSGNYITSWVTSINYDGSVVLGYTISKQWVDSAPVYTPFIWTKEEGIKDFNDYVTNTLKFDLKGDQIFVPTMLSANEKYIVGWGLDGTYIKVFRIQLPNLSTDEIQSSEKATLYPNPVTNVLNIDAKEDISEIKVYNMAGQQVLSKEARSKNPKIDMSTLKAGVYVVEVTSDSNTTTHKVIKK